MRQSVSHIAGSEPNPLEISFPFKPKNGLKNGNPNGRQSPEPGNVPRISKLMALAIRFEGLTRRGDVRDYADLARLGYVTRARITQIMNLLNLAPEIQEAILFLPRTIKGHDPIRERDVRPIAGMSNWGRQRRLWKALVKERIPDHVSH